MELSRSTREGIGRGTALLLGLILLWNAWRCYGWAKQIREQNRFNESELRRYDHTRYRPKGLMLPDFLVVGFGAGGVIACVIAAYPKGRRDSQVQAR